MKDFAVGIFALARLIILIFFAPVVTIWAVNTIAEHSASKFYIEHNIWTWLAVWFFLILGGSKRG